MKRWVQRTLPAAAGLVLMLAIAGQTARAESASTWFKRGQAAEARDDADTAYEAYLKAHNQKPEDLRYKTALYRTRVSASGAHVHRGEKLSAQGDFTGALTEFLHALEIDPSNELAQQDIDAARRKLSAQPSGESSLPRTAPEGLSNVASPIELKPVSNEPLTLHMVEDSKIIYQTIGKAAGINVLFDPEYTSKRIPIDLSNVSLYDALRILGTISNTFWRPVTSNTIFVAQNTRAKRNELDEQAVQTFYLTNAAQQNDLNDIQTALRNVLSSGSAKLYGVPSQNAIVMRATPDELLLAQKLISDLDKARPEVLVDVAVMEVSREKMRNIGIQLPQTATVTLQGNNTSTTSTGAGTTPGTTTPATTTNLTLNTLAHLNATNFAVTVGQAQANLLLSDSNTRILQNPRIRATDSQKASMKVGSRIPIATGSFSNGIGAGGIGGIGAVQTQFQYLDVGVNVDITPTVHYDRDVTLKLKIEVSAHSGDTTISGVTEPIISQRTVEQVIRLKEGEANIIGGILTKQDSRVLSGTPGLAEIPLLKYLFGSNSRDVTDDEIVFLLIPHVVRATQLSDLNLRTIDTGTGSSVDIRREPALSAPANVAPVSAAPVPNPPSVQSLPAVAPAPRPPAALAPVMLQLTPSQSTQKTGSSFQVAVNLSGGQDVFSVPLQMQYDAGRLSLINVDSGDFLGRDGQAVALVHRDDGSGGVTISASRPPGVGGISGAGAVCILTFQAKQPGDATVAITRPAVKNSAQQALPASGSQAVVHVQ